MSYMCDFVLYQNESMTSYTLCWLFEYQLYPTLYHGSQNMHIKVSTEQFLMPYKNTQGYITL